MSISRFQATVPTPKVQNDRGFHLRLLLQTQFANLHLLRNFPKQKMISKQRDICSSEICMKYALMSQSFLVVHQYTPLRNELLCKPFRALRWEWISSKMKVWHSWQLKNIKTLGAFMELPAKQHCQFSLFGPFLRQDFDIFNCHGCGFTIQVKNIEE